MPAARTSVRDASVTIKLNGTAYTLKLGDCTGVDANDCRRATGYSLQGLLAKAGEDPDLDVVAAVVWLARRQAGEPRITFESVAKEIGYDAEIEAVSDEEARQADADRQKVDELDPEG